MATDLNFKYDGGEVGDDYIDIELDGEYTDSLNLAEAESALKSLTEAVYTMREAAREAARYYVQVRFDLARNSQAQTYTYIDPSGTLAVGDLVQAPVYEGDLRMAKVVALGRGRWTGPCKPVAARLEAMAL
jgi:hypothetical protein